MENKVRGKNGQKYFIMFSVHENLHIKKRNLFSIVQVRLAETRPI